MVGHQTLDLGIVVRIHTGQLIQRVSPKRACGSPAS